MAERAISIGTLSAWTGSKVETVRYYERIGLMPEPPRRGRYRSYDAQAVTRLGFIRRARDLGFTLNETRELLALSTGGSRACRDARAVAASHLQDVRSRIADLRRIERVLAERLRACDFGHPPVCPLIDSLFNDARIAIGRERLGSDH
jgi:MerR family mercuric resistance operon transcriptional regulator